MCARIASRPAARPAICGSTFGGSTNKYPVLFEQMCAASCRCFVLPAASHPASEAQQQRLSPFAKFCKRSNKVAPCAPSEMTLPERDGPGSWPLLTTGSHTVCLGLSEPHRRSLLCRVFRCPISSLCQPCRTRAQMKMPTRGRRPHQGRQLREYSQRMKARPTGLSLRRSRSSFKTRRRQHLRRRRQRRKLLRSLRPGRRRGWRVRRMQQHSCRRKAFPNRYHRLRLECAAKRSRSPGDTRWMRTRTDTGRVATLMAQAQKSLTMIAKTPIAMDRTRKSQKRRS
eukprot:COSAG04_NODE_2426_length_4143_cov_6.064787_1_plen_284_part_00